MFVVHRNNFCEPAATHHTMFCKALLYLSVLFQSHVMNNIKCFIKILVWGRLRCQWPDVESHFDSKECSVLYLNNQVFVLYWCFSLSPTLLPLWYCQTWVNHVDRWLFHLDFYLLKIVAARMFKNIWILRMFMTKRCFIGFVPLFL